MGVWETFIWSALAGALLLVLLAVVADLCVNRGKATAQNLCFMVVTVSAIIILTGLPEHILQISQPSAWFALKLAIGPLASAQAFYSLGSWLGMNAEDAVIRFLVTIGTGLGTIVGLVLLATSAWAPLGSYDEMMVVAGAVSMVVVILGMAITLRAERLGDGLAKSMFAACVCLAILVVGLYIKVLLPDAGLAVWLITTGIAVLYYMIVVNLTLRREHQFRHMRKLAKGIHDNDPVTGLPTSAVLVSKVDDCLWRAQRNSRSSMVLAVWIGNLYSVADTAGRESEQEIRMMLTARLRRAMGFHHVVGVYHARCFVIAIGASRAPEHMYTLAAKAQKALSALMIVGSVVGRPHKFNPEIGFSIVYVGAEGASAIQVMDQAERLAQHALLAQTGVLQENYSKTPVSQYSPLESAS